MSNINTDVKAVMTLFKSAADDHISKNKPTRSSTQSNNIEVSPSLMHALGVMLENIFEREDNAKNDMRIEYEGKLSEKQKEIDELRADHRKLMFEMDALAQYNRSENIKIHNIKYSSTEETNQIVKDLGKHAGVLIKDEDISISHRLMSKDELEKLNTSTGNTKLPPIIVRFNRRDIKSRLLGARKNIQSNNECPINLKSAALYEDVTPLRSRIMYQLRQRDDKKAFKFVWSKGGRIYARTHEEAAQTINQPRPHLINTPDDLIKVGFSKVEIENIIKGVNRS